LGSTLLVTLIIGLVGALVLHATIIENQRDLDQARVQIQRIAAETEALESELAELEAPARIVQDALDLGMIEAPSIAYITAPAHSSWPPTSCRTTSEHDNSYLTIAFR